VRIGSILGVATAVALIAAPGASPKEGARAQLLTPLPLAAKPGSAIQVRWSVDVPDGSGGHRPFGAGGMFVRLLSATGADPTTGFADGSGRFATRVRVPEGGIGGVRAGLRGTRCDANGCRRADALFPLVNDPFRSPGGVRCDVAALRKTLGAFVRAYNRGDYRTLDRLFAREPRFIWYSSGGPARSDRDALTPNFERRHERGDRLRLLTYSFNGYDWGRDLGHFGFEAARRADDLRGGKWFESGGKGALDCAQPPATIAVMIVARR
jgi:hypothetical protein